jgi:tetratricopeptide (TPR) repeat protein
LDSDQFLTPLDLDRNERHTPLIGRRRYKLDVEEVCRICESLNMTYEDLVAEAGLRELPSQGRVSGETLAKFVDILGAAPEDLIYGPVVPSWRATDAIFVRHTQWSPAELRAARDRWRRAHANNMKGLFLESVKNCQNLLQGIDASLEPELAATVRGKLVCFLDDAGLLDTALFEVDKLLFDLADQPLDEEGVELVIGALLSRGRILHRLHCFSDSREVLERVRNGYGNPYRISANHQLGAAALGQYYATSSRETLCRARLLDEAQARFEETIEEWRQLNFTYREGFSRRRLAEILLIRGEYRAAANHAIDALDAFATFGCIRYKPATRAIHTAALDAMEFRAAPFPPLFPPPGGGLSPVT